jgi:hypothetical protein
MWPVFVRGMTRLAVEQWPEGAESVLPKTHTGLGLR